jgi:hypothetical protein
MIDLGGVSPGKTDTFINVGKNNKLQAIALDFDLIIRAIDKQKQDDSILDESVNQSKSMGNGRSEERVLPNVNLIQSMAKLLNVNLGGGDDNKQDRGSAAADDISLIAGMSSKTNTKNNNNVKDVTKINPTAMDIRTKYAKQLRSKVDGGLAGVELANSKREEALNRGDAAGHLAARKIAASDTVSTPGSKWIGKDYFQF